METYQILEKALALIEDERDWRQGSTGYGDPGAPYCALEACTTVGKSAGLVGDWELARESLKATLRSRGWVSPTPVWVLPAFNDTHSHAEVVALFQEAIRTEKAKAGIPVDLPVQNGKVAGAKRERAMV